MIKGLIDTLQDYQSFYESETETYFQTTPCAWFARNILRDGGRYKDSPLDYFAFNVAIF